MRRLTGVTYSFCRCVWVVLASATIAGQGALSRTVWDGVYTPAQAARGKVIYAQQCSRCHGDFLDGGPIGRAPLVGAAFTDNWESMSVHDLFVHIHRTMPRDAARTLSTQDALDLVAFVLQSNE